MLYVRVLECCFGAYTGSLSSISFVPTAAQNDWAHEGFARQSSICKKHDAHKALFGDPNPYFIASLVCASTESVANSWWIVYFTRVVKVTSVTVVTPKGEWTTYDLRHVDSVERFKSNIKTYLFKAAFINYL